MIYSAIYFSLDRKNISIAPNKSAKTIIFQNLKRSEACKTRAITITIANQIPCLKLMAKWENKTLFLKKYARDQNPKSEAVPVAAINKLA